VKLNGPLGGMGVAGRSKLPALDVRSLGIIGHIMSPCLPGYTWTDTKSFSGLSLTLDSFLVAVKCNGVFKETNGRRINPIWPFLRSQAIPSGP